MAFYRISEMETRFVDMGKARMQSVAGELMKAGMITYPEDGGPPPHFHPNEEQFLLVTSGKANVILGEETRVVVPGDLVHVPRSERHGLRVLEAPFSFFTVKSPAGDGDLYQDYNKAEDAEEARKKLESTG